MLALLGINDEKSPSELESLANTALSLIQDVKQEMNDHAIRKFVPQLTIDYSALTRGRTQHGRGDTVGHQYIAAVG